MTHAEQCPVCFGKGKVNETETWSTTSTMPLVRTCHGCGGRGWITVNNHDEDYKTATSKTSE